jgi:hypothetical protein
MILRHEGFLFEVGGDGLPRVRDLDLAERLGYENLYKIRELIARYVADLGEVFSTVGKTAKNKGGRPGREYWLTEEQAYLVAAKSETPEAMAITKLLIRAFIAARDELRGISLRNQNVFTRLLNAIVLPAPAEWERMFPGSLVRALCALHNVKWIGGAHPRMLASTNRKIYDMIFSADIAAEIKAGNPNPKFGSNHHQSLTPDARTYLTTQLVVVEALARAAQTKDDFWAKMEAEYAGGMTQLTIGLLP